MKPKAYLGLDIGGTGAKAGVVDPEGRLLAIARRGYQPVVTPEGHIEISIEQIYEAAREATTTVIRQSGAEISALSISSQGQTFVSLDGKDQPLHPAIIWYDSRATEEAEQLRRALQAADLQDPLPEVTPIATVPKIMWLREHHPVRMAEARRFLLLPDYFAYRLTGRAATDPCTAASTGVYAEDIPDYCPAALAAAGIIKAQMAEIQQPGQSIGQVLPTLADEWELTAETLVITGTNDQYAGALGAGNCQPGIISVTIGTCLALVTLTERLPEPMPRGLSGGRFPIARYQFALAFAKTAGVVLEWFNRELSPGRNLRDLDQMVADVPPGSRGVVALPHFDGMISPTPDAEARGAFLNLSLQHTRAHLYHAILESLGFSLRENLELLQRSGLHTDTIRAIGGAAKSDYFLQMNADITGFPIERPLVTEAAVLGAAMIAAVGGGTFATLQECSAALYKRERVFIPEPSKHTLYEELYHRHVELYRHVYRQRETPGAG